MDAGEAMYMLVGSATPTQVIQDLFDLPSFSAIPDDLVSSLTAHEIRAFFYVLLIDGNVFLNCQAFLETFNASS